MDTLGTAYARLPDEDPGALVPRRRGGLLVKSALAAVALAGLALFVRELPDLRRYLRVRRM